MKAIKVISMIAIPMLLAGCGSDDGDSSSGGGSGYSNTVAGMYEIRSTGPYCYAPDKISRYDSDGYHSIDCTWYNYPSGKYAGKYVSVDFVRTEGTEYTDGKKWHVARVYTSNGI